MFAWGYPSRQRLDSIRLGGGLRLQADGDSRRLALTSQKYTLKSMILKDSPSDHTGISTNFVKQTIPVHITKPPYCTFLLFILIQELYPLSSKLPK